MRTKIITLSLFFAFVSTSLFAQEKWTLNQCINHAIKNNIELQQSALDIKNSDINLNTAKNSRLPSLSANLGGTGSFGRGESENGTYINHTQASSDFGVSFNVPIYSGSRINNTIKEAEFDLKSIMYNYEGAKESLSLNVVALYMKILFSKEFLDIANQQLDISNELVRKNNILFKNGKLSEGEYYESVSSAANDNLTVTEAKNNLALDLLDLAHTLNIPNAHNFDISSPNVNDLNDEDMLTLITAKAIYNTSVVSRPSILGQEYKLKSLSSSLKIAKSAYIPSVSFSMGYGNSYFHTFTNGMPNSSFIKQMEVNGGENISLGISIPIFNRFATRNNIKQVNLNIRRQNLTLENEKLKLYKTIELSHKNAEASMAKYFSSKEAVKAAKIAFAYEKEKTEAGRSTIFDFNDSKISLIKAESNLLKAKYEFLLNKKILDFYNGFPLTENN